MKSNKKCPDCGEFEEEDMYAGNMNEGQSPTSHIVSQCKNYEKCPKYNRSK